MGTCGALGGTLMGTRGALGDTLMRMGAAAWRPPVKGAIALAASMLMLSAPGSVGAGPAGVGAGPAGVGAGPVNAGAGPVNARAGRPVQQFKAPAAGSYILHPIQRAPDGRVLDTDGKLYPLGRYTTGKVTLLSFMYTYCVDPVGCPLAFDTFDAVRKRLLQRPALARQVRLVSLSFDPTNDTPAAMRAYGGALADPATPLRWHFLTTRSVAELKPIIDDFGQDVAVTLDRQGRPTRLYNHLVKVFLIDSGGRVREIYTTAYLLPDVLLNDVETVLLAGPAQR